MRGDPQTADFADFEDFVCWAAKEARRNCRVSVTVEICEIGVICGECVAIGKPPISLWFAAAPRVGRTARTITCRQTWIHSDLRALCVSAVNLLGELRASPCLTISFVSH